MRTSLEEYWVAKKAKAWLTSDYPYKARDGSCKGDGSVDVNVTGVGDGNTYAGLVEGINQGPVSIGIAASGFAFQFYSKGIVKGSSCKDTELDHGVTIVASGTETGIDNTEIVPMFMQTKAHPLGPSVITIIISSPLAPSTISPSSSVITRG